jgi:hypothetical protein
MAQLITREQREIIHPSIPILHLHLQHNTCCIQIHPILVLLFFVVRDFLTGRPPYQYRIFEPRSHHDIISDGPAQFGPSLPQTHTTITWLVSYQAHTTWEAGTDLFISFFASLPWCEGISYHMTMKKHLIRPGQGVCAHYATTLKLTRYGLIQKQRAWVDDLCGLRARCNIAQDQCNHTSYNLPRDKVTLAIP